MLPPFPRLEVITTETIATSVRTEDLPPAAQGQEERGFTLFWGISGGSILGALGFVALTLYQQYNDSVVELQRSLKHFNTTCADLVKKDDFNGRAKTFWNRIEKLEKGLSGNSRRVCGVAGAPVEEQRRGTQGTRPRRPLLRERLATVEGRQSVMMPRASQGGRLMAGRLPRHPGLGAAEKPADAGGPRPTSPGGCGADEPAACIACGRTSRLHQESNQLFVGGRSSDVVALRLELPGASRCPGCRRLPHPRRPHPPLHLPLHPSSSSSSAIVAGNRSGTSPAWSHCFWPSARAPCADPTSPANAICLS